jgi:hypothetical protein
MPGIDDPIRAILARDTEATSAEKARAEDAQRQAEPLAKLRAAMAELRSYPGPPDAASANAGWCERLRKLHEALKEAGLLCLLDRLPERGMARRVVLALVRRVGEGLCTQAAAILGDVAPRGYLDRQVWRELTTNLSEDLWDLVLVERAASLGDGEQTRAMHEAVARKRVECLVQDLAALSRSHRPNPIAAEDYHSLLGELGRTLASVGGAKEWAAFDREAEFQRITAGLDPTRREQERRGCEVACALIDQALAQGVPAEELTRAWGLSDSGPTFSWIIIILENLAVRVWPASPCAPKRDPALAGTPEPETGSPPIQGKEGEGSPEGPAAPNRLEKIDLGWRVTFGGASAAMLDAKVWGVLARLLGSPDKAVNALVLEGAPPEMLPQAQADDVFSDRDGLRGYHDRLNAIRSELPELYAAADAGDEEAREKAEELEAEHETIRGHIRQCTRKGKPRRDRRGNEAAKAADRIKFCLGELRKKLQVTDGMAPLAEHLRRFVEQEGDGFAYRPDPPDTQWHIQT